jgi:hypothetical protein
VPYFVLVSSKQNQAIFEPKEHSFEKNEHNMRSNFIETKSIARSIKYQFY